MKVPKALSSLIESFEKLPGVGPKTSQRLSYYLLHVPQAELDSFSDALANLKRDTVLCSVCKNVSDSDPCPICSNPTRDHSQIMLVEQPLDVLAFEKTAKFKGVYHVLHGSINPLENIGPDELYIEDLFTRVKDGRIKTKEIIIATNPTMEGEATAMYISKKFKEKHNGEAKLKITRLGMGIPTGASLEFADETTLTQAIEGRRKI
jgi:recombination protein RecR